MQVLSSKLIKGKRVLLRLDIDVPLENGKVIEDFRLKASIPTVKLCLENAAGVLAIGHIGRPQGQIVDSLRVAPIIEWFKNQGYNLNILENLRFDPRESFDSAQDKDALEFAKELASKGDVFINEAFAAYHPAVSTTILPKFLPHAAGLRFAQEVRVIRAVKENPKKPFIAIMGGAKVEDKLPVILVLAQKADAVLVGGKLVHEIREQNLQLPANVLVGKLNEDGFDISPDTTSSWARLISRAAQIIWNGPLGKFEDPKNDQSAKLAQIILESGVEVVVGGGDTIALLGGLGLLGKFEEKGFVSVGGGAMLKLLSDGTLPTIEALN